MRWVIMLVAGCSAPNGTATAAPRSVDESRVVVPTTTSSVLTTTPITMTVRRDTESELTVSTKIAKGVEIQPLGTQIYGTEKLLRPNGDWPTLRLRWDEDARVVHQMKLVSKFHVLSTAPIGENRFRGVVRYRVCQQNVDTAHYVPVAQCGSEEAETFDLTIIVAP